MKKIFTHLFALLLLSLVSSGAWAQFENGKVYRIVCSGTNSVSLGASALTDVAAVSTSETEKAQQWYVTVSDNNYTFRNLANGRYLLGNNGTSQAWGLTETSNDFTVTAVNGNYAIRGASHTSGYGYMHKDNGNNIVSWESGAANSQWTPIMVEYTAEELQAVWDEVEALVVPSSTVSGYQEKLDAIFSDKACTALNSEYTSANMSDDALETDVNYLALPQTLRDMVKKVRGGDWSEKTVDPADRPNGNNRTNHSLWTVEDTWDNDYAKKFRVQMYEPYSVEGEITSYLRINAHCNMDNPTGIYANAGEPMYIMVEGTIEDGAELWVAHQVGHGATNYYNNAAYTQLHEGLNVVPYFANGSQLWINYLVHTYDADGATIQDKFPHKLSDYEPLKIHIEGGYINGFFNAMGDYRASAADGSDNLWGDVDNDEDWNYYKARAALSGDFALLGHRQTLLFPFGTYNSTKEHFGVANAEGGIEYALAYHLENITVPETPNCYAGSGKAFGDYSNTYYPGMQLSATTGKINIMLEAWDRIQYSEHASLGLLSVADINKMNTLYPRWTANGEAAEIYNYGSATVNGETKTYKDFCQGIDYSDYYNHHGAAVGSGSGYMSGGWRVCNYHYNTMGSIIGKIAAEAGPTWGPAHEIGHQHQSIFNLNGQTEVTNNFHSNVAVWYMGMGTSRYNGSEGSLASVLGAFNTDGNDLYTNNIWAITHLYYRLWLYYHLAGNNTQFWPRLFELCRQVPLVNGGQISGETSLLRFYQHACDAAGEDLTEFFRAHGFFEIMTDRLVGDYSNGTYNVTEEQIETAISAVKAKGYPNNYAILLINDGTSETTLKHDGESKRALWDNNPSAEYGSVTAFIDGETSVTDAYEAVVSADGTVTMSGGSGGVGFLILNEKGEIVSFSNKATFQISDEAAYLLATGKASVVAVDAESVPTESEVDLSAIQREMLKALINKVEAMPIDDGSYTHVGFYTKASAGDLLAALESAKTAYESGSGYGAAYEMLYTEKEKFVNSPNLSFVPFDPSLTYVITNCAYSGKTMHLNSGLKSATGVDQTANTARWQFKTTDTEGVYKLYNTAGYYLTAPAKSATVGSTATVGDAATFTLLQESPVGAWSISLSPAAEYTTLHDDSHGKVVGWSAGVDPSKWYLTAVENSNSASLVATDELQALIAKTEALVDVVGMAIPCALQTTDATAPFYLYCNANVTSGGDASLPADGYNILDGNDQTFLHTVFNGDSQDGLNHYLLLDLGAGNTLSTIQFYYKTRHNGNSGSHPQVIKVEGSNDKENFEEVTTISSGLPNGFSKEYTSSTLTNGKEYRYFRFMVTDTYGTATDSKGHEYFYIAEFGIPSLPDVYTKIDAEYQAYVTDTDMQTIYNAIVVAKAALESGTDLSTAKDNLQTAYDTFYALYKKPIDEKKTELEALADATDEVIATVGTVELGVETPITLTTSNLYCNQVNTTESGSGDSYIERLTDGDTETYLHTTSTEGYLRIDLGENSTATAFKFSYTTRSNGNNRPTNIVVEGCNEQDGTYTTITELSEGLPSGNAAVYNSDIINMSQAYRYVRLRVTNAITNGGNSKIFVMSELSITTVKEINITIDVAYDGIISEDLLYSTYNTSGDSHLMAAETSHPTLAQLEAQITKLTEAKQTLEAAMNNVNKSALEELIAAATTLYNKMSDGNGNMNADYATSALTADQLTAVKDALDAAQSVVDYAGSTQLQVNEAKSALDEKYQVLLNVEKTNEKSTLATDGLTTLIGNVNTLLETIADATASRTEITLQVSDADSDFYLWSNAPAGDSDGIGALLDNNTGTFFGTQWGSVVDAYTHYIEIDMGDAIAVDELLFGYTTRNSTHANQRPTAIKVLGSNNKVDYTEIETISDGLATGAAERWSMDTPMSLAARYRYIRFAVATQPTTGYFNMSEFDLYANIDYSLKDYYTTATGLGFVELCLALQSAEDLLTRSYITTAQYNAVYEKLSTYYTAANSVVADDYTTRTSLETLIDDTETLIDEVATVSEVETPVLSTANLYCNADNSTNGSAGDNDKRGVAALLDGDLATHLHTTYGNNAQDDDLDHYIRVDMGEDNAVAAFEFSYTGRNANSNNDPSVMVIQGCNTLDGEWEEIKTLTGLPTEGDKVQYASGLIEARKSYRYIRFMVTETENNSFTTYNGKSHKFFVMSEFGFTAHSAIEVNEGYTNVTKELVRAAYNEKKTATGKNACYMSESEYNEALDALQADYDALNLAKNLGDIPVILTTDVNNPVLYKIYIGRTEYDRSLLAYDESSSMVAVANLDFESTVQNWYFMQGTDENSYGDVLILPATADGKALATNSFSVGDSKVTAQGSAADGYSYNWEISPINDTEWYNIKMNNGSDTYYYFSNHGGYTKKMGFYNSNTSTDGGSMFHFVLADAYSVLKDCYDPLEKEPEVYAPGYFSNAEQFNAAYDAASEYVNCANGTEEQYIAAYNELFAQKKALTTRTASDALEDGAVYRIMNLITKTAGEKYHYIANSSAAITFPTAPAEDNSDLWVCKENNDGTYEFVSALGTLSLAWKGGGETSHAFKIDGGVETGAKSMRNSSEVRMALTNEKHNSGLAFNHASNNNAQDTNWSTDWYFQKVEEADVKFNVNISSRRFSSLYLPYDVEVPEGVSAFTAVNVDGNNVDLYRVADRYDDTAAGSIIPARTPVILYLEDEPFTAGVYTFTYAPGAEALSDAVAEKVYAAIIFGKILQTPIQCDANTRYYKLGGKSGDTVSKMYWMYKEYGSDGTITNPGTDDGGYIRCSANKIYMTVAESVASNSFSMRFGEGTTGISEVKGENGKVEAVYDLQGRKVETPAKGLYIINGKKVLVK